MSSAKKCAALTKLDKPCKNNAKEGFDYCNIHLCYTPITPFDKKEEKYIQRVECEALTKDGKKCKNLAKINSNFCYRHECTEQRSEVREMIPDLENIMAEYLDINEYSKLIKIDSSKYSWDKYFEDFKPDPKLIYKNITDESYQYLLKRKIIETAIQSGNMSAIKYIVNKYNPELEEFYYYIPNLKILKYFVNNKKLDETLYFNIISNSIDKNLDSSLNYMISLNLYDLKNLNYGQDVNDLVKSNNYKGLKTLLKLCKKYCNKNYYFEELENALELSKIVWGDEKNEEWDKLIKIMEIELKTE